MEEKTPNVSTSKFTSVAIFRQDRPVVFYNQSTQHIAAPLKIMQATGQRSGIPSQQFSLRRIRPRSFPPYEP